MSCWPAACRRGAAMHAVKDGGAKLICFAPALVAGQEAGALAAPMRSSSRAWRPAAISARSRPACWRRRSCRRSARCRCSSPAASAAARRSLAYLRDGRGRRASSAPASSAPRELIAHPELQAGLHPRRGARRGAVGAARPALPGDPGARARQRRRPGASPRPSARSSTGSTRRARPGGGAARDRAFLGRRAAPRGDRRRCRDRLADGRPERRAW